MPALNEVLEYSNGQLAVVVATCGEYDGAQLYIIKQHDDYRYAAIAWYSEDEWCFVTDHESWRDSLCDATCDIDANVM